MPGLYRLASAAGLWAAMTISLPSASLVIDSGDFEDFANDLRISAFESNSGEYVTPLQSDRDDFRDLAAALRDGDMPAAQAGQRGGLRPCAVHGPPPAGRCTSASWSGWLTASRRVGGAATS